MSGPTEQQVSEAIVWNAYRATEEAVQRAKDIAADSGDLWIWVTIEAQSDSFPGKHESGRSKSRRIGYAVCGYRNPGSEQEEAS